VSAYSIFHKSCYKPVPTSYFSFHLAKHKIQPFSVAITVKILALTKMLETLPLIT